MTTINFIALKHRGVLRFHYLISMTYVWICYNVRLRCCKSIMIRTTKSTIATGISERFKDKFKVTILAWLNQMKKFLTARQILLLEWVTTAYTYLETNVAQHWDILALELTSENKDPQLWDNFYDALLTAYGYVNQELVARNKLRTLRQKGYVEEYANEFQQLCSHITKSPLS